MNAAAGQHVILARVVKEFICNLPNLESRAITVAQNVGGKCGY